MAKKELAMLAGGGHACVLLDALERSGVRVNAIVDPAIAIGQRVFGVPVVGDDSWLDVVSVEDYMLVNGAGALPRSTLRQRLFERGKQNGFVFIKVVHPATTIGHDVELMEGAQIMAGAILQFGSRVHTNAVINTGARIDHGCEIGEHVFIGPGAILCGNVRAGPRAFIGAGAVVLPGIEIGTAAVIGSGAIVTKNVRAGTLVIGNPAIEKKEKLDK